MSQCIPAASVAYFSAVSASSPARPELTPELVEEIESLREEIRAAEGGGGYCHVVTEILSDRYGWARLGVAYLSEDGVIICGGGHVVNVFPDGSVLDPTRDQFGEGHSVSLIRPDDPEIGRYRPEFYEDFHPGHPDDTHGVFDAWLPTYAGVIDADVQNAVRAERGDGWWLSDDGPYLDYLRQQDAYRDRLKASPAFTPR